MLFSSSRTVRSGEVSWSSVRKQTPTSASPFSKEGIQHPLDALGDAPMGSRGGADISTRDYWVVTMQQDGRSHAVLVYALRPHLAYTWPESDFPRTAACWTFDES